jgi:TonB-dependent receptor
MDTPLRVPATASALAMVMALSMPAHAQDDTSEPLEEVVVTGLRQSLESAQAIKKNADQIVESVTAQDIGALPDRSVSEALQRIPGVTLQRTNENRDPARLASEGGGIFIRGLSWVRSEANGRDIFSANNGRGLSFEDVSADLLAGVDVYKNPSAEMIEGGVGGIVNLRTRLPFDSTKRILAFSADYNYADLKDEGFTSGNALYSDQWETGAGRLGGLLSVSIGNIGNRTDSVQTGRFEPHTAANGSTVFIPNSFGWRSIEWEQKRTAVAGALQWAPTDAFGMTFQGLYTEANPRDIERALGDTDGGYAVDDSSYTFGPDGVIQTGTIRNIKPTADTRFGESHKRTSDYALNFKYTPNEQWTFSADLQYVQSHADVLSMTAFTQLGGAPLGTLDFDLRGATPTLRLNQPAQENQAAYWWAAAMDHLEDNEAHSFAERVDIDFAFDDNPWLESFRFGLRGTDKNAITRQTGWNWGLLSQQFWGPNDTSVPGAVAFANSNAPGATELFAYDNFMRGDVQLPGIAWFPTAGIVSNGTQNAFNTLKTTQTAGWGWTPLSSDFSLARPGADNISGGINDQQEQTKAVYAMLRFAHDTPIGRMDGNFGVRVVETQSDSAGVATQLTALTGGQSVSGCQELAVNTDANPANNVDCAPIAAATTFLSGGTLPGSDTSLSYTDTLPSINMRFHLTDDLQLRFAWGKAIVRPTFSQLVGFTTLNYNFLSGTDTNPELAYTPNPAGFMTGSGGNPTLKPTKSNQFDTSIEWYFAPTGALAFGAFYKDITNYIFAGQAPESYTANGLTQTFNVTRNINGPKGKIQGFEVAYTQFYDRLPGILSGLGMQANFTYVDSSGGANTAVNVIEGPQVAGAADQSLPLEGLSKTSYNLTALYEKYDISARLAYNWRERFLLTTSAANIQRPVWSEDYGQLDASVFYNLTPKLKLGLQGTNLLNTRTFLDVGGAQLAPRYSWTDTDRRIAVAMRMQF